MFAIILIHSLRDENEQKPRQKFTFLCICRELKSKEKRRVRARERENERVGRGWGAAIMCQVCKIEAYVLFIYYYCIVVADFSTFLAFRLHLLSCLYWNSTISFYRHQQKLSSWVVVWKTLPRLTKPRLLRTTNLATCPKEHTGKTIPRQKLLSWRGMICLTFQMCLAPERQLHRKTERETDRERERENDSKRETTTILVIVRWKLAQHLSR